MIRPADLAAVQSDIDKADSLLAHFHAPWDADDSRPLWILKDVLDAQQRALVAMLGMLERESRISAAQRGRVSGLEAWVS